MTWSRPLALAALTCLTLPFVIYAAGFGLAGLRSPLPDSYLFSPGAAGNAPMSAHTLTGAALTLIAPLQVLTARRANRLHRTIGPVIVGLALVTAVAGLLFIALNGTIGGANMTAAFTLYGLLLATSAAATAFFAAKGNHARHRRWALRLIVLALASWIFRLHYVLWFIATDGVGSTETLSGPFDRIQVWAFFLPYLALLELRFRTRAR